jgi:hypothetical protein
MVDGMSRRCRIEGCRRQGIRGGICTTHRYRLQNELPLEGRPKPRRRRGGSWRKTLSGILRKILEV